MPGPGDGGRSSIGRAPALQAGGRRFDPGRLHHVDRSQVCGGREERALRAADDQEQPVSHRDGYPETDDAPDRRARAAHRRDRGWGSPARAGAPEYESRISPIGPATRELMTGRSWRPGCPVGFDDLRVVRMSYWGFDRRAHTGRMVVHRWFADDIARVFHRALRRPVPDQAHAARRPLRRRRHAVDEGKQHLGVQLPVACRRVLPLVAARLRARARPEPGAEPVRMERRCLAAGGRALPRSVGSSPRHGASPRSRLVGLPCRGVGMGRRLDGEKDYQHFSVNGH